MPDTAIIADTERRSAPSAPSRGLPLVSTAPLSHAEREALRELRRRFELAAVDIGWALEANTVAAGLDRLNKAAGDTDGLALALAGKLGSGR